MPGTSSNEKEPAGYPDQVLVEYQKTEDMKEILFRETSTLGIRQTQVDRYSLSRNIKEVSTLYGMVRIKITGKGQFTKKHLLSLKIAKKLPGKRIYLSSRSFGKQSMPITNRILDPEFYNLLGDNSNSPLFLRFPKIPLENPPMVQFARVKKEEK